MTSTPTPTLDRDEYRVLRKIINEHCGLAFPDDAAYLLEKRLGPRLQRHGLADFGAYCQLLRHEPDRASELEALVEALTIHETYLFREPHQLRAFEAVVLPALASANATGRRLRIWSAGCSTGEEVYTIAALVVRSGLFGGWDVEVLGSDLVQGVLATAREGAYRGGAFRTPEAETLRPYFHEDGGEWVVADEVRALVRFVQVNLIDPRSTSRVDPVDVVFCRNVLIYFDLPSRRRVLQAFWERMRDGGFLLLGHSESLLREAGGFEAVPLETDVVYRKPRPSS